MKNLFRAVVFLLSVFSFSVIGGSTPAFAKTQHARHHVTHKKSRGDAQLRDAQKHLIQLGYYKGRADGLMGPKTKKALKGFQRDQGLRMTGTLTKETRVALAAAAKAKASAARISAVSLPPPAPPQPDFYATHPDFYGHVDQQYADPMVMTRGYAEVAQPIPSRYGQLRISEDDKSGGGMKRFNVILNGRPILQVGNQPSVIGISETYELGDEDAIIFSTYEAGDRVCAYKHYLLTMREGGEKMQLLANCTRGYQAHVDNNSLFVSFPEADDSRSIAATWRYDNGDLVKL